MGPLFSNLYVNLTHMAREKLPRAGCFALRGLAKGGNELSNPRDQVGNCAQQGNEFVSSHMGLLSACAELREARDTQRVSGRVASETRRPAGKLHTPKARKRLALPDLLTGPGSR